MKKYEIKVIMIIDDYMDREAKTMDDAILDVQNALEKTEHKNLMLIFTSKPKFIYEAKEKKNN